MKSQTLANLPTLREMLAAGVHFGHRKERSKPAARKYTFVIRDGVCVINLEMTQEQLTKAVHVLEAAAAEGQTILLVGTKRQARLALIAMAKETGMPYVANRWLGGTLTNYSVIRNNIQRLIDLDRVLANDQEMAKFNKRERLRMEERARKLHSMFDGITDMTKLPDYLLVVDPYEETTAVREAEKIGIPVIALCDTDGDPDHLFLPIPTNDDAPKAIELLLSTLSAAIVRGKEKAKTS